MTTKTKTELEAENAELLRQIEELKAANAAKNGSVAPEEAEKEARPEAPSAQSVIQPIYVTAPNTDVEVVYTSHSPGHVEGKMFSFDASVYGETFSMSRAQFDELAGKYRNWFNDGRLAVSHKNIDVAAMKGLRVDTEVGLTVNDLRNMGKMSTEQIEKLWDKVGLDNLRLTIVTYYKDQFSAGAEGFRDRARIDCLNRLTNGGFDAESQIVGGKRLRIHATDLLAAADEEDTDY